MSGLAIVGASDRTIWTEWLLRTLSRFGYDRPIFLINPTRDEVLGRPCHRSVEDLPEVPDVAILVVGAPRAVDECGKLVQLGCSEICVIANGFRETGLPEGRELEDRLRTAIAGSDARVTGPNCVGFARFHENLCALAQPLPKGIRAGDVSVISQSGGLTGGLLGALEREGFGFDLCYSIGNGVGFSLEEGVEWAVSRGTTRYVCCIAESIGDLDRLARTAAAARAAGKEIVFLLLGHSPAGREAAKSHTGSVLGEQALLAARLEELDVFVAESITEQARIVSLLETFGRLDPTRGAFVITASGGGATLTADTAERHGAVLSPLQAETVTVLKELLPPGPYVGNPLDVTAGNGPGGVQAVYDAVAADPTVGILVEPYVLPWPDDSEGHRWHRDALERLADGADATGIGVAVVSTFEQERNPWITDYLGRRRNVSLTCGLEDTMKALGKLYRGSGTGPAKTLAPPHRAAGSTAPGEASISEVEGRVVLERAGFTVPAGGVARSEDEAAAVASGLKAPFVVKVSEPKVAHKGRIGGVEIGITSEEGVRDAWRRICGNVEASGTRAPNGVAVLVAEMVFGPELLVATMRDRVAGPSLTVAIGGWAAESGAVFGTLPLPAAATALAAFVESSGLGRLAGDAPAAHLVSYLDQLAQSFVDGPLSAYETVEINPLILTAAGPVAADVLLLH
ncbi:MAG: acetate--CoA ligase family protein [Gaiellales bacterium]